MQRVSVRAAPDDTVYDGGDVMVPLLLVLLVILVLFGAGFAVDVLWYIAIALLVLWVLGFFMRSGSGRWYRW